MLLPFTNIFSNVVVYLKYESHAKIQNFSKIMAINYNENCYSNTENCSSFNANIPVKLSL